MYLDYFGLTELPFSIAPDPRYLYMSERHKEALAHLLFGVGGQGGFVVLTGEVGTGKTTICRCFLSQVPESTDVAFVINPKLSAHELLASICDEFKISYQESASIKVLNDAINRYLLDAHSQGRHTVLVVDEAQNLSVDVLEQLRLLTNLETSEKKLLQIILLGQPELKDMLAQAELRQLSQRVTARYHLNELNGDEVAAYIKCRLAVAGRTRSLFSAKAIKQISRLSGGIPRLINLIADRALLGAYASHAECIESRHVKQAYREIQGEQATHLPTATLWWGGAAVLAVVGLSFALGFSSHYSSSYEGQGHVAQALPPKPLPATETTSLSHNLNLNSVEPSSKAFELHADEATLPSSASEPTALPLQSIALLKDETMAKFMAYQSLFKRWGVFYPKEPFMLACEFAELNDLKCLHRKGTWRSLLNLDRPAVMSLRNAKGEALTLTLLKLDGERAFIAHNQKQFWVARSELDRYWQGDYSLVYQLPPYRSLTVEPGELGEEQWLRERLFELEKRDLLKDFDGGRPSQKLRDIVARFQARMGLVPDGIAGSMTLIHLNSLLFAESPRLLDQMSVMQADSELGEGA